VFNLSEEYRLLCVAYFCHSLGYLLNMHITNLASGNNTFEFEIVQYASYLNVTVQCDPETNLVVLMLK
jgi:hypothetical protein